MCVILMLAACAPQTQQPAAKETTASVGQAVPEETGGQEPVSKPESTAPAQPPASENTQPPDAEVSVESEPAGNTDASSQSEDAKTTAGLSGRVNALLTVYYDGDTPRFSQKLTVPASATFSGGANAVTVERHTETGWQAVRGGGAGNFTLEGKLTVNGPLPPQVLEDAALGTEYRLTTVLQTGDGGEITAVSVFRAGETFAVDAAEKELAAPDAFKLETHVDMDGDGLLPFTQTITNTSGQTVLLDRAYTVLRQSGRGVWKEAAYPDGDAPSIQGTALLLPGASYTESGLLPVTASQARRGGNYRILRTAMAAGVTDQTARIEFYTDLEAGKTFSEAGVAQTVRPPALEHVALVLEQTSFLAGEVPVAAWLENKSPDPIVAGKLRVYNVIDGGDVLPAQEEPPRWEIPVGGDLQVLDETLALETGEYTVEITVWPASGGAEASVAKNFTVEQDKLKNAASAATVEMKVAVEGQTADGLATFTQTFTNRSCQTLLVGRDFYVERPAGGLWAPAEYPEGLKPAVPEDLVLLRPGESAALEGTLPFEAGEMPGRYRITRTLMVDNPQPSQRNGLTLVYTVTKK